MKDNRALHNKPHKTGKKGYYGKRKEWQEQDEKLAAEKEKRTLESNFLAVRCHICGQSQGIPLAEAGK